MTKKSPRKTATKAAWLEVNLVVVFILFREIIVGTNTEFVSTSGSVPGNQERRLLEVIEKIRLKEVSSWAETKILVAPPCRTGSLSNS